MGDKKKKGGLGFWGIIRFILFAIIAFAIFSAAIAPRL